jgi:hypothetical protein
MQVTRGGCYSWQFDTNHCQTNELHAGIARLIIEWSSLINQVMLTLKLQMSPILLTDLRAG